jgi:hypothetical protein
VEDWEVPEKRKIHVSKVRPEELVAKFAVKSYDDIDRD